MFLQEHISLSETDNSCLQLLEPKPNGYGTHIRLQIGEVFLQEHSARFAHEFTRVHSRLSLPLKVQ
jgi:hypothetical protein